MEKRRVGGVSNQASMKMIRSGSRSFQFSLHRGSQSLAQTSIATAQREPREIRFFLSLSLSLKKRRTVDNYEKTDITLGVRINVSFRINLSVRRSLQFY